ncbi:MAG: type II secretion system protein GspC [Pseudomonadota bacterium]
MTLSIKHYLWLGNVIILGFATWSAVTLGMTYLGRLISDGAAAGGQVQVDAGDGPALRPMSIYQKIADYRIFGEKEEAAPADAPKSSPTMSPQTSPASRTAADLKLVGVVFGGDAGVNLAIVEEGRSKEQNLYRVGDRIGSNELIQVAPNEVLLREGDKDLRLALFDGFDAARAAPARSAAPPEPAPAPGEAPGEGDHIAKPLGDNKFLVSRESLGEHLGDLNFFMAHVRIQPYFQNGQPHGFKIASIKAGSPVSQLGFQQGDILLKVNDVSVGKPEDLVNLYRQVQQLETITVDLERRGAPETLTYSLR